MEKNSKVSNTDLFLIRKVFEEFKPENRSIISQNEMQNLNAMLELDKRDVMSLRNLRNTAVMFSSILGADKKENASTSAYFAFTDLVSALTGTIDAWIIKAGGEI